MECNFNGMDISFSRSFQRGEEKKIKQHKVMLYVGFLDTF